MGARRGLAPREVFLSHASADRALADALSLTLRKHGVPVWYSSTNLQGAQQWLDEIGTALERCDWFLLLLSRAAVRFHWVKQELVFALNSSRYRDRIVPVLVTNCDWNRLSWTLGATQMIPIGRRYADAAREILKLWGIGLNPAFCIKPAVKRRARGPARGLARKP